MRADSLSSSAMRTLMSSIVPEGRQAFGASYFRSGTIPLLLRRMGLSDHKGTDRLSALLIQDWREGNHALIVEGTAKDYGSPVFSGLQRTAIPEIRQYAQIDRALPVAVAAVGCISASSRGHDVWRCRCRWRRERSLGPRRSRR